MAECNSCRPLIVFGIDRKLVAFTKTCPSWHQSKKKEKEKKKLLSQKRKMLFESFLISKIMTISFRTLWVQCEFLSEIISRMCVTQKNYHYVLCTAEYEKNAGHVTVYVYDFHGSNEKIKSFKIRIPSHKTCCYIWKCSFPVRCLKNNTHVTKSIVNYHSALLS